MMKYEILKRVKESTVVAVVRAKNYEEAMEICLGCLDGGIDTIEITYSTPNADQVIQKLNNHFGDKLLIGAGTVLDATTARISILNGAKFIVSPGFDLEVSKLCNLYQIPYIPGCMTINEMIKAVESGVDVVKLFPGNAFGPDFIKAVKAPLPQINIMPSGGVNVDNIKQWLDNGCVAVSVGGNLCKGSREDIAQTARKFLEAANPSKVLA